MVELRVQAIITFPILAIAQPSNKVWQTLIFPNIGGETLFKLAVSGDGLANDQFGVKHFLFW